MGGLESQFPATKERQAEAQGCRDAISELRIRYNELSGISSGDGSGFGGVLVVAVSRLLIPVIH